VGENTHRLNEKYVRDQSGNAHITGECSVISAEVFGRQQKFELFRQ